MPDIAWKSYIDSLQRVAKQHASKFINTRRQGRPLVASLEEKPAGVRSVRSACEGLCECLLLVEMHASIPHSEESPSFQSVQIWQLQFSMFRVAKLSHKWDQNMCEECMCVVGSVCKPWAVVWCGECEEVVGILSTIIMYHS